MALSFVLPSGQTVYNPGAYNQIIVNSSNTSLSVSGVVALVGEADGGPDYTLEADITQNFYGPGDLAVIQNKYKSGNIVNAFAEVSAASSDTNIVGAPTRIFVLKTNPSTKASANLVRSGLSNYGVLADKSWGVLGNNISTAITANTSETPPTTGAITWIPSPNTSTLALRVNGKSKQTLAVSALAGGVTTVHGTSQLTFVGGITSGSATGLNSLSDVLVTGGTDRGILAGFGGGNTLSLVATGNSVLITLGTGTLTVWATTPSIGDTLIIPANTEYGAGSDSVLKGPTPHNEGAYVVTAVTSTTITATKLRSHSGSFVAPETVTASSGTPAIVATTDLLAFSPVVINNYTGVNRGLLTGLVGQNISGTASGSTLTLTLATGQVWAALPQAGDYLFVPSTAPANISNNAGGWLQVVSATSGTAASQSQIVATYLSDGAPGNIASTAIGATTDIQCLRPVIDGRGKALEIYDGGGTENVSQQLFTTAGGAVTWFSSAGSPQLLTSASEYSVLMTDTVNTVSQATASTETLTAGGIVALLLGYNGTTGTVTISDTTLSTTVTGGFGSNLSLTLSNFNTLGALASYINTQTGYVCTVATGLNGQLPVLQTEASSTTATVSRSVLDTGTYNICSELGSKPGRIKRDANAYFNVINQNSGLVQLGATFASQAAAGLPEVQVLTFFAGGSKGGTANNNVTGAIDACQKLQMNFLVPLFAQDASSDITAGLTDPASTYTVDSINAYAKTHVIAMSVVKVRKNRQALCAKRDTYANVKIAAQNLANFRVTLCFQDFKATNVSTGSLNQFQPWMSAVAAAGMQAAGFYKALVKKFINTSGMLQFDGSFSDQVASQIDDALQNGLLFAEKAPTGGYRWVSDQTTYSVDNNFVYNSLQAVYVADVIALTLAQRLESQFVGQSLADISAGLILSGIDAVMDDFRRLKLIASSSSLPKGYGNVNVKISAPGATVSLTVVEATALYFIGITTFVSNVQVSASGQ
jgi:hypothetical protein